MQNQAKNALRKQIKQAIKQISIESRHLQSTRIAEKVNQLEINEKSFTECSFQLINLSEYQKAKRVSIYLSTEYEVCTIGILKRLFEDKKEARHSFDP
jgi:5-formyltetrahydrofolate cyclo-ligase